MTQGKRALMAAFRPNKLKSLGEMRELFMSSYPIFKEMEAVQFKAWWVDEERGEWGAFYIFDSEDSLKSYVESERWLKVVPAKYGCVPEWRAVEPGPILSKILVTDPMADSKLHASYDKPMRVDALKAPPAIGPYSQAVRAGDLLFVSGQIALDPSTGQMVEGHIKEQTERVLDNILEILRAAGLTFESVVKTEVFLAEMGDFKAMNEVYESRFTSKVKPARQTVGVAALPKGALVEISCIAFAGHWRH